MSVWKQGMLEGAACAAGGSGCRCELERWRGLREACRPALPGNVQAILSLPPTHLALHDGSRQPTSLSTASPRVCPFAHLASWGWAGVEMYPGVKLWRAQGRRGTCDPRNPGEALGRLPRGRSLTSGLGEQVSKTLGLERRHSRKKKQHKAMEMGRLGSVEKLAEANGVVNFMCRLDWVTRCPDI